MGKEIERKFLLKDDSWRAGAAGTSYRQGYLHSDEEKVVRVRVAGSKAFLTIKGKLSNISRDEFEYQVPLDDANELLANYCTPPLIEKTRFKVKAGNHTWEVDEFFGANAGLVVAEIELSSEDEEFERPPWLGEEVSDDERYYNANLARYPFSQWK